MPPEPHCAHKHASAQEWQVSSGTFGRLAGWVSAGWGLGLRLGPILEQQQCLRCLVLEFGGLGLGHLILARARPIHVLNQAPSPALLPQCRNIDPSSLFSICPTKTPEGEGAGLLQTLTIMSKIRVGIEMEDIDTAIRSMDEVVPLDRRDPNLVLIYLNSEPIAKTSNPLHFLDTIRTHSRTSRLPNEITTILTSYGIMITTDIGIITFPLLHLESLAKLPAAIAEAEYGGVNLWKTLLDYGIIEYTDAWESQDHIVAFKKIDKTAPQTHAYTHMAPHPTSFFSTAAGTIPFANHNQAPRNTYQSNMAEQAISAPCLTASERHEMNYRHILWYPQQPVCTTHIAEVKGEFEKPISMYGL